MKYLDVLRFSLRGIRTSPLRSALSALSVAVGTGALLIIASLGLFGRTQIENGLARIGVSGLAVSTDEGGAGTPLSAALAERMAQAVPGIKAASPVRAVGGTVRAGHRTSGVVLLGADENLGEVMQVELLAGALPLRHRSKPVLRSRSWGMNSRNACTDASILPAAKSASAGTAASRSSRSAA